MALTEHRTDFIVKGSDGDTDDDSGFSGSATRTTLASAPTSKAPH